MSQVVSENYHQIQSSEVTIAKHVLLFYFTDFQTLIPFRNRARLILLLLIRTAMLEKMIDISIHLSSKMQTQLTRTFKLPDA